ncbi:MAG: hypothetical protein PT120_24030 [Aphanizomenon gracile PMC649.10]|nr:hypothetical protein [Aphanizomenon gracile PMC649.10]
MQSTNNSYFGNEDDDKDEDVNHEGDLNIFYFDFDDEEIEGNYSYPPEDTELSREVDRMIDELIGE